MKKYFIILILPFFIFFTSSCRSNALKLFEHGEYQEAINKVDSIKHPTSEDYLAKARSLTELGKKEEAKNSILMYLLTTNEVTQTTDRVFAVNLFLEFGFSNELTVLCLSPEDGIEAQIALYKAYSKLKDNKNSRQLIDAYLYSQLNIKDLLRLIIDYPTDSTFTMGIFESWFEELITQDKQDFAKLLEEFSNSEDISEQCARSIIHICQSNEKDRFYTSSKAALETVYKTHIRASEVLKDQTTVKEYREKIKNLYRVGNK